MPLLQVRDMPEDTLRALKVRAAEQGLSLTAYVRGQLEELARRPTNADVARALAARRRDAGPTLEQIVDDIRRTREAS